MGGSRQDTAGHSRRIRDRLLRREQSPSGTGSPELARIERSTPAPQAAAGIAGAVFLAYVVMHVVNIMEAASGTTQRLVSLAALLAFIALQVLHVAPRFRAFRNRYGVWTLAAQAALTLGPHYFFGIQWGGMGGFVAGSALLILPARTGWPVFVATVAAVGLISMQTPGLTAANIVYAHVATALTGLVVYSLTRLWDLVIAIHVAREELARMAVARERLRFARDLHDLLGYSLSTITLKSELIYRLISGQPERAKDEVMGVLDVSRQALADVREVARGYRDMSLLAEAGSAKDVLEAAGLETSLKVSCGALSAPANTVLATVLREGVTNLLRHSEASRCTIDISENAGTVRLSVVNDGVPPAARQDPDGTGRMGTGLDSLSARAAALGGRLSFGSGADGTFHLVAEVPAQAVEGERPDPAGPAAPVARRTGAGAVA